MGLRKSGLNKFLHVYILVILLVGMVGTVTRRSLAAITLRSFDVFAGISKVDIYWETATELNNSGFYILRSLSEDGNYERITNLILSEGDDLTGYSYSYTDTEVVNGTTYWYTLEAIDTSNFSDFYGPIPATPGETQTATPTATTTPTDGPSPTPTQTPTATGSLQPSATPTRTLTPAASSTPIPTWTLASSAFTATSLAALQATQNYNPNQGSLTAEALALAQPGASGSTRGILGTLVPLPTIEFEFPDELAAGISSEAALSENPDLAGTPEETRTQPPGIRISDWLTPPRLVVFGALGLIWSLLGVWFILTMRQLS